MSKIEPQPGIMDIALYQGGASTVAGVTNVLKLSSNENPFGPSEATVEAFRRAGFENDYRGLMDARAPDFGVSA